MRRQALVFAAPGEVQIVDEPCPAPGAGEVRVQAHVSAISGGTELLAYHGQLGADLALDETLGAFAGASFAFPFRYGYASVGVVTDVGAGVSADLCGRRVFAFVPHASVFVAPARDVFLVPDAVADEAAALYASGETAVNLVLDGRPQLGERVAVFGLGPVGLLTAALLVRFPLAALVAVEPAFGRALAGSGLGVGAVHQSLAEARAALGPGGADLSYELTGNPAVLDDAIATTGAEGRVVVGSFYGNKRAPVDLGGHFHRGRLTLVSSQVSHLGPALRGRWDRARRMATTFAALARIDVRSIISHRVPFAEAASAYRLLASGDPTVVQVILVHAKESS